MPRQARGKSSTKIYHIMLRGINRQSIFEDEEDNEKFLQILADCKVVCGFEIYAYCLMGNHVHLLLKVGKEELQQIFKRVGARYVYWFNWKYRRSGHLFQDRFKSEPVEEDEYFVTVLRYIHQNPLKAQICPTLDEYKWSSYNDYINKQGITDTSFALEFIGAEKFIAFMNESADDSCLEMEVIRQRLTDEELKQKIIEEFKIQPMLIQNEPRDKMVDILKDILQYEGVSTRQLSRVTGIPTNIIWRIYEANEPSPCF